MTSLKDDRGAPRHPAQSWSRMILRLEAASAATVRGEYLRAAQIAEEVFASGVYDARFLAICCSERCLRAVRHRRSVLLRDDDRQTKQRLVLPPRASAGGSARQGCTGFDACGSPTGAVRKSCDGQREAGNQPWPKVTRRDVYDGRAALAGCGRATPARQVAQPLRRLSELFQKMHHQRSSQGDGRTENSTQRQLR